MRGTIRHTRIPASFFQRSPNRFPFLENQQGDVHNVRPPHQSQRQFLRHAVITPRWLFVLAAATPAAVGDPILVHESLEQLDPETIQSGDIVGISVHTGNALRGYQVGKIAHERGATVIYGGIHATLFPEETFDRGHADVVAKGDGDVVWGKVLRDLQAGTAQRIYDGGKIKGDEFLAARWGLDAARKVHEGLRPNHSWLPQALFLLLRLAHRRPETPPTLLRKVIDEIIDLRRLGFRFIALADDNFYPVTLTDLRLAREQGNHGKVASLPEIRNEPYALMAELAKLPKDMVFFTQITMKSAEDTDYLDAMRKANIKGALVNVEAVTPEGLKAV